MEPRASGCPRQFPVNGPGRFATSADTLRADAETVLWRAFKDEDSVAAREQLFALHAPFARSLARRHYRERSFGDVDIADLRQLAYEGLLEALDRFDPLREVPFRGFAAHRIRGSILNGIARMNELREQLSWRHRLRRERTRSLMTSDDAVAMSTSDTMAALAELAVSLALGFMLEGTGMMTSAEGGRLPLGTAYDSAAWKEISNRLLAELASLPEREQIILRRHYIEDVSFEHLARLLDLSKARVSQLHRSALAVLRRRMAARGHFRMER